MTYLVKALSGTEKGATDLIAALLILVGCFLIIGGCVYRVFVHPEWTFEQSLEALWPFLATGTVSFGLGWLIDRSESAAPRRRQAS